MSNQRLVLASASPRRKGLLEGIGLNFEVLPSAIDEIGINGESPEDQVLRLAQEKARDVAKLRPDRWILGADTIVVINDTILGKPNNTDEAFDMLSKLSGNIHEVFTGYMIMNSAATDPERRRYVKSKVLIRELSDREILDYISTGEPLDKAGSYAIQGIGAAIVQSVGGSYTNVVGLPICEVALDLKQLGIFDFLQANRRT